ncbi:hypothetical protein ACLKA6_010768 [Drosophila palustris]
MYVRGIWPGKSQVLQGNEASKATGNWQPATGNMLTAFPVGAPVLQRRLKPLHSLQLQGDQGDGEMLAVNGPLMHSLCDPFTAAFAADSRANGR